VSDAPSEFVAPGISVAVNIFRDSGLIAIAGIRVLDRTRLDTVACDSYEVMKEEYDQLLLICLNEGEFIRRSLAATEYLLLLLQPFSMFGYTLCQVDHQRS